MAAEPRKPYPSDLTDVRWGITEALLPSPVAAGAPRKPERFPLREPSRANASEPTDIQTRLRSHRKTTLATAERHPDDQGSQPRLSKTYGNEPFRPSTWVGYVSKRGGVGGMPRTQDEGPKGRCPLVPEV